MRYGWLSMGPSRFSKVVGATRSRQTAPVRKGKGVCERDRTAILNRGSGGQGQPNIGIVWQETFTPERQCSNPGLFSVGQGMSRSNFDHRRREFQRNV